MHVSTVRSSAIISAKAAGPDTRTGAQDTHTAAMHVKESSKLLGGRANAVLYQVQDTTPRTPCKSKPHMQLLRAIRAHMLPQALGGRGTDRADRLERLETCLEAVPDFEHHFEHRGPAKRARGA